MTPEPRSTQSTVLVVEDDPVLNRLLTRQLAKAGHAVGSADTWAGARQRLPALQPDLVLLDLKLPDSADFVPLRELAARLPVVMLTAYGNVTQAVEAMRLGAADYLVKPGDEIVITLWGSVDADLRTVVDRSGRIAVNVSDQMRGAEIVPVEFFGIEWKLFGKIGCRPNGNDMCQLLEAADLTDLGPLAAELC